MERVLARRDENWRKLQQYVLDEREQAELVGPGVERLFGFQREYTWYIRDGVFVGSPVPFNGLMLDDNERRTYESKWIASEREQEARRSRRCETEDAPVVATPDRPESSRETLARFTPEPQFVSAAAHSGRFRSEPGHYALVGRERFGDREALRIEYYPSRLYTDNRPREDRQGGATATETTGSRRR